MEDGKREIDSRYFRNACWLSQASNAHRYLMCNAEGRWDGAQKAYVHAEMCSFYVAIAEGISDELLARAKASDKWKAVHEATQALTDNLDTEIGFPLKGRPDYDTLAPLFFERFHDICLKTLCL